MRERSLVGRRITDAVVRFIAAASALAGIAFLAWILIDIALKGGAALNWDFFTKRTGPFTLPDTGMANAIVGTLYLTLAATIIGVPIGLLAGVYLSEFGKDSPVSTTVRFVSNALMGIPSILIGVFVYTLLVVPMRSYSGYAGGVALGIIMLPVVARTTEDMLNLVPNELRESALALGAPRWKATLGVIFRAARTGLVTGVLLAVARISGETAPLLFTAFNNNHFTWFSGNGPGRYFYDMREPTANLTVTIFQYAMSPYERWREQAWGASLLITAGVLVLSVVARIVFRGKQYGHGE
jgi:phosphate transport system permease protein